MPEAQGFAEFVAGRQQPLLRFAMVLCGDAPLAEELVADVLARSYERWQRIGEVERPNAYVRRMVVNEYLSSRRRTHRTMPLADPSSHGESHPDHAIEHAERAAMIAALAQLPRKQRATLVLRFYEGQSDAEIASILGCSQSTVRSNAARALAALRINLATDEGSPSYTGAGEV